MRQKHVPGSIETNHGSLSKIIGNCWRQLPLDEKRIWEIKAKQEKANHKAQFPHYRFRPIHNKNKNKDKSSTTAPTATSLVNNNPDGTTQEEEERRCEQVAHLLLEGMKGEELARAVRDFDRARQQEGNSRPHTSSDTFPPSRSFDAGTVAMPIPMSSYQNPFGFGAFGYGMNPSLGLALPPSAYHRRSSSVPLPLHNGSSDFFVPSFVGYSNGPTALDVTGIALPSVPYMSQTRPSSPINNISRQHQQRTVLGHRRASSAQPVFRRSWTEPFYAANNNVYNSDGNYATFSEYDWTNAQVQRDPSPLPDVDHALFNGFSFDEGVPSANDHGLSSSVSSISSSASASSASNRNSPWLETPSHSHTRSHSQHRSSLSIAPHDLPPLDLSPDMNWRSSSDSATSSQPPTAAGLLSASSTTTSSSSTFPSPLSSTITVPVNEKSDSGVTPTLGMFDLHHGYGLGNNDTTTDMHGMGGVDYEHGYSDMLISMEYGVGDMGMGGYSLVGGGGNDMGEMDTMWQAGQVQSQDLRA